ncbi:unnamed protein product [marine sediment metagenome]|uniref:ASCH domain-containing protein n=1 Tax=marine sediment metagenome TaxID=412755 RepID=X0XXX1_9ZZZZ
MPALNFRKEFAEMVRSGRKRQTIRAYRKDGRDPKVGDTLYLYVGMRTKGCRLLGEHKCTSVEGIALGSNGRMYTKHGRVEIEREDDVAERDGFASFDEMVAWFRKVHGLPFDGLLIRW